MTRGATSGSISLTVARESTPEGTPPTATSAERPSRRGCRQYGSTSEYVRELIRRNIDRSELRNLLLAGAQSEPAAQADAPFIDALRDRARHAPDG